MQSEVGSWKKTTHFPCNYKGSDVTLHPVHYQIEIVIKKGGGNRPLEALATL